MSDQQQRTQWAVDRFRSFIHAWTAPASRSELVVDEVQVLTAIRDIAPKGDADPVGYGVFRREIDADWDIRQRPSGWVHTLISAVFDKPAQAENVHASQTKKHPDQHFIICEIREIP